jgi:hypothetical protein
MRPNGVGQVRADGLIAKLALDADNFGFAKNNAAAVRRSQRHQPHLEKRRRIDSHVNSASLSYL